MNWTQLAKAALAVAGVATGLPVENVAQLAALLGTLVQHLNALPVGADGKPMTLEAATARLVEARRHGADIDAQITDAATKALAELDADAAKGNG